MRTHLIACLILVGVFFPLGAWAATLEEATVNIYCSYTSGRKTLTTTGSGVFISERGVILTNAHVVMPFLIEGKKGGCSVRTDSPARATYSAELLYLSPSWAAEQTKLIKKKSQKGSGEGDFALLRVTSASAQPFPALAFDEGILVPQEGEAVTIGGYPVGTNFKKVEKKLLYKQGDTSVIAVRYFVRPFPDVLNLAPNDAGVSGSSGGPVIGKEGAVEALITAIEDNSKKKERTIRAITLFHIERTLLFETGTTLRNMLSEDLAARASLTNAALSENLRKEVTKAYFSR